MGCQSVKIITGKKLRMGDKVLQNHAKFSITRSSLRVISVATS
jgi:hypothetical protein